MARTKQVAMKSYAGKQAMKKSAKKEKTVTHPAVKKEPGVPVKIAAPAPASKATKVRAKRK